MKPAACSCRVRINRIDEVRRDSSRSRFSSPGTPKMYVTPSASSARTNRSDAFTGSLTVLMCGPILTRFTHWAYADHPLVSRERPTARPPAQCSGTRFYQVNPVFHQASLFRRYLDADQHGDSEQHAHGTPQPAPYNQPDNDNQWIQSHSAAENDRRDELRFKHIDAEVHQRRQQRGQCETVLHDAGERQQYHADERPDIRR